MLTSDMNSGVIDRPQGGDLRLLSNSNIKKRSFLTVDGVQEPDAVEVIVKDFPEERVKRAKKFRVEWMDEWTFKDWLKPHPTDETYCICSACDIKLRCGKSELEKHASGLKHTRRMEAMNQSLAKEDPPIFESPKNLKLNPSTFESPKTPNSDPAIFESAEPPNTNPQPETVPQAHIYCEETGPGLILACEEPPVVEAPAPIEEHASIVSESAVSGVLLKVLELVEGKMSFTSKKLEMAEMEHECKMQILRKELHLKSLEVQIKEAELQKLKSTSIKIIRS